MRIILVATILLFTIFSANVYSQTSGEWYGVGTVNRSGDHNSYLVELDLKQTGNKVTGKLNYFFKSEKIEAVVTGVFLASTRTLELKATPVLNYKAKDNNGADCPMEGSFTYMSSQLETTLRGQFNPLYSYRYTCPAINVKLKKQLPSAPPITRKLPEETEQLLVFEEPEKPRAPQPELELLNKRSFDVVDEVEVEADTLTAILYDNSEIDYDTVSLFYNKRLITSKSMLSDKPLTFKLPVNDTGRNEISMYAENLGKLPPNTALLIIMDGTKRLEFNLVSTYIKNSTLRFRKKKAVAVPGS